MHTTMLCIDNIYREKRGVVNKPGVCVCVCVCVRVRVRVPVPVPVPVPVSVCASRCSKIPGVLCSHSERTEDGV